MYKSALSAFSLRQLCFRDTARAEAGAPCVHAHVCVRVCAYTPPRSQAWAASVGRPCSRNPTRRGESGLQGEADAHRDPLPRCRAKLALERVSLDSASLGLHPRPRASRPPPWSLRPSRTPYAARALHELRILYASLRFILWLAVNVRFWFLSNSMETNIDSQQTRRGNPNRANTRLHRAAEQLDNQQRWICPASPSLSGSLTQC